MRNTLHPFSKAQYIRPGTDTFLTQNKLAIPVGPKYRRLLGKIEPDPLRVEMKALFKKVIKHISKTDKQTKKRLIQLEKERPAPGSRDAVLFEISRYQRGIRKDPKWNKGEKEELLKFLDLQAISWGMDGSKKLKTAQEELILDTWQKFTKGMTVRRPQGEKRKPTVKKAKAKAKAKAVRLEGELSASTMVQGVRGEVIDKPLGQTVGQEKSQGKTPKTEFSEGIEDREKRTI